MARSDLLQKLFAAHSRGDENSFQQTAQLIILDERRKRHHLLADELESALRRSDRPGVPELPSFSPVPKGRDDRPLLQLAKPRMELEDLILTDSCSDSLVDIAEENRNRSVLASFGLRPRQRLLFIGRSGTGKTAAGHALGARLSLPVATVSLAAIISSFLGETAKNLESVVRFAEATPCVLLLDEFDAIAGQRHSGSDHAEMDRLVATILQILEEMQGESVAVATSNHPSTLDAALWRRFDEVVYFGALNIQQTAQLIKLRTRAFPSRLSTMEWAATLSDLAPAEVEMVCVDALRFCILNGIDFLDDPSFEVAAQRVTSRRSVLLQAQASDVGH